MSSHSSFHQIVRARHSVRKFLPNPLTVDQLRVVLTDAQHAPSNCNTQPWIVHVASGETKRNLSNALREHAERGRLSPDFSWDETAFPDVLDARRKDQGRAYYQALGIERSDAPGRREALLRNLDFFGAPHVAFLFLPAIGDSVRVASDVGMYAQTLLLALSDGGFGAVPQTVLGLFADPVRQVLGLDDDMKLLFGISFGYADTSDPASSLVLDRAGLEDVVTFHT